MRNRKAVRAERPLRQAIAYLFYDVILIGLACMSAERWVTLICAFVSVVAAFKAIGFFAQAIFYRDEFLEEEFVLRISVPRS